MTDYISPDVLREYIGSETTNFAATAQTVCTVTSRTIEAMCDRVFLQDSGVTDRFFSPATWSICEVDDISTTAGLVVATDDSANGTYSTIWTLNIDYYLEPINQKIGGIGGWPFTELRALLSRAWVLNSVVYRRPPVKVSAQWGWPAVPDAVTHAALVGAARLFKMKDAADGFIGLAGWGPVAIRENPEVRALLYPFMKAPYAVA